MILMVFSTGMQMLLILAAGLWLLALMTALSFPCNLLTVFFFHLRSKLILKLGSVIFSVKSSSLICISAAASAGQLQAKVYPVWFRQALETWLIFRFCEFSFFLSFFSSLFHVQETNFRDSDNIYTFFHIATDCYRTTI